ncbi:MULTISPECIES: VIT1/CCC1 transporter family protein [unclassified Halomonas]|uniref:VIT1/CCC1 transporter family protein n=1 Tax=unclassified Halomonas TaxID=2609666 RepID=UPI0006DBA18A|nr:MULTISPECIES: VIT family protein [unclassified Halomonas]KPQ27422.1 MAG: COG1814 family membrane protein [Halomonas sp. HL-93]SBR49866.1 Predicted Fe2+/Mn2+ transporter, VIT1/CCC1 family [Halomonas sp. HL-93]SNY96572.1 Predicted Fe2+/Mn2+ transporter, VIT1/CCC1 family [Halomonas sp. hl-4]
MTHIEPHRSHRTGWLRAAVLGANDGIVSTSSLILGVAAANTTQNDILLAGIAGLVAGAMSMAAGEYVSVSSQSDTENADLEIERKSLDEDYEDEQAELGAIYEARGLTPDLASQVAQQLMKNDALGAHARDDIGLAGSGKTKPLQAALSSASTFTIGALFPLLVAWWAPHEQLIILVALFSLLFLAFLGAIAACVGGAPIVKGAWRVMFWGALAMALTAAIGRLFGIVA